MEVAQMNRYFEIVEWRKGLFKRSIILYFN